MGAPHTLGKVDRKLTRSEACERFDESLVVWIDPTRIEYYVWKNLGTLGGVESILARAPAQMRRFVRRLLRRLGLEPEDSPFFIPRRRYTTPIPLERVYKYWKVKDLIACGGDYTKSKWFVQMQAAVQDHGFAKHKLLRMQSVQEVHEFFRGYAMPLIESMERHGYNLELGSEHGTVMIGADSRLHKANAGDHRFFVARLVGVKKIPLRVVGIHEDFARRFGLLDQPYDSERLSGAVRAVEREHR